MKHFVWLLFLSAPVFAQEREIRGPQWFRDAAIYFHDFESETPLLDSEKLQSQAVAKPPAWGLFGGGLATTDKPNLKLRGAALSAHGPLTISFWWSLPRDLPIDGAFNQFQLSGKGIINAFVKGKGEWCDLKKPAGVCQIYYFGGIQNVNGIYDFDLQKSLDLRANIWHHSAAVLRGGNTFQFFTNGKLVSEMTTSGRGWNAADELQNLEIGGGVILDDVAILNRAVDGDFLADYYRGVKQLHDYRQP
jgi:hypothetical protein